VDPTGHVLDVIESLSVQNGRSRTAAGAGSSVHHRGFGSIQILDPLLKITEGDEGGAGNVASWRNLRTSSAVMEDTGLKKSVMDMVGLPSARKRRQNTEYRIQ
jgi:hypothetical protein